MSKVMTVEEALASMSAKEGKNGKPVINRFNKKNFTMLMTAMANDPDFTAKVVKVKNGDIDSIDEVMVTKGFRKFCKKVLEKAGVDKNESDIVYSTSFEFSNSDLDGLYEFFADAVYEYMKAGNQFDLLPTEEFKGSISIKDVCEVTKTAEAFSPKDRSSLGVFETTKKAHKELAVKSSCPSFLKSRKKIK